MYLYELIIIQHHIIFFLSQIFRKKHFVFHDYVQPFFFFNSSLIKYSIHMRNDHWIYYVFVVAKA